MLVIIVSLGFGVIKPRLGPMLHRIVGVGALYFILATVDAFVHVDTALHEHDNMAILFTQVSLLFISCSPNERLESIQKASLGLKILDKKPTTL